MQTIYFTIQAKGSVGKILISSYLMQYQENKEIKQKEKGIDTDARTFGENLRKMYKAKQIFNEVLGDTNYTLIEKQRLIGYKNKIFDSIALSIG